MSEDSLNARIESAVAAALAKNATATPSFDTVLSELQKINGTLVKIEADASTAVGSLAGINGNLGSLVKILATNLPLAVTALQTLAQQLSAPPITGITVQEGTPTIHPVTRIKNMFCNLTKKSTAAKFTSKAVAKAVPTGFNLQDNGDNTLTVFGVDQAGNQVDISTVATIAVTSATPAAITVDTPVGMTFGVHAPTSPAPAIGATSVITITATWTDGSTGPFTLTLTGTITGGAATGLGVSFGTPTIH